MDELKKDEEEEEKGKLNEFDIDPNSVPSHKEETQTVCLD